MATFRLTIKCDNAAFRDDNDEDNDAQAAAIAAEVGRILRRLGSELQEDNMEDGDDGTLHDANGNTVGKWTYGEDVPAPDDRVRLAPVR